MSLATVEPVSPVELTRVRELCQRGHARTIRESARLSLSEIAQYVGVGTQTISYWERGQTRATGERAIAYLHVLEGLCRSHDIRY